MERRKFLRRTSVIAAGIAGLAGCGSPSPDGTDTEPGMGTEAEPGAATETE